MVSDETCLSPDVVLKLLAGELSDDERHRACAHLDDCQDCQDWVAASDSPEPASDVGLPERYELRDELGRGGMGVVVRAWDRTLERDVAVKVLHPELARGSTEHHRRLLRESKAMARLRHPNVVTVYDALDDGERVFVTMEYVEGRDLRGWLDEGSRPWRDILKVFVLAGEGLAAAHRAGLVHRDFKPANVLIGPDGSPQVTDFGLARPLGPAANTPLSSIEAHSTSTLTGGIAGTPAYMAPEQITGAALDARTDVFAFCVSLWEALHGERPFNLPSMAARELAIEDGAVPIPKNSEVPKRINAALIGGMAYAADDRPQTMEQLLERIEVRRPGSRRFVMGAALAVASLGGVAAAWIAATPEPAPVATVPEPELPTDRLAAVDRETALSEVGDALGEQGGNEGLLLWSRRSAMVEQYWDSLDEAWRASFEIGEPKHRLAVQTCLEIRRAALAEFLAQARDGNLETVRRLSGMASKTACGALHADVARELWLGWAAASPAVKQTRARMLVASDISGEIQTLSNELLEQVRQEELPPSVEARAMLWEATTDQSPPQRDAKLEAIADFADGSGLVVAAAMAAVHQPNPPEDTRVRVGRLPAGPTREELETTIVLAEATELAIRRDHAAAKEKIDAVMPKVRQRADPKVLRAALRVRAVDPTVPFEDRLRDSHELLTAELDRGGERSLGVIRARMGLLMLEDQRGDFDAAADMIAPAVAACSTVPPCSSQAAFIAIVLAGAVEMERGNWERAEAMFDQAASFTFEKSGFNAYLLDGKRCRLTLERRDREEQWPCAGMPEDDAKKFGVPMELSVAQRAFSAMLAGDAAGAHRLAKQAETGIAAAESSRSRDLTIILAEVWLETGDPTRALQLCQAIDPDVLAQEPTDQATVAIFIARAKHALGQDARAATRDALQYAEAMHAYPKHWAHYLESLSALAAELGVEAPETP